VTYGKVGTAGQSQAKTFATPAKAQAEADKLIREKTGKGYVELTPAAGGSTGDALAAAIRADPHDRAAHAAYADWLTEQGDPKGEFIQVQLALEDETLPSAQRKTLQAREKELLKKHKAEWVGAWADFAEKSRQAEDWTPPKGWVPYGFTRGVLTRVEVGQLNVRLAREIIKAPQLRFVRELIVHDVNYYRDEEEDEDETDDDLPDENASPYVLVRWPQLRFVRVFRYGGCDPAEYDHCPYRCHVPADLITDFAKQMSDVEELHVMAHFREEVDKLVTLRMPRLRVLLLYHGWNYPLEKLAKNPSLTNLRELYCHPHALEGDEPYIRLPHLRAICRSKYLTALTRLQLRLSDVGDAGAEEVVTSGILKRLKVLDLRHGVVTDEGAKALAASPDLRNLDHLDLAWNRIGPAGVAALRKTGVSVNLTRQDKLERDTEEWAREDWETFGQGDYE
jgi:uncharacterized protein (TIGR02996 family)